MNEYFAGDEKYEKEQTVSHIILGIEANLNAKLLGGVDAESLWLPI